MKEPFAGAQTYLNAFLLSELLVSATIILVTSIYYHTLSNYLLVKDRKVLLGQLFNFYILGAQLIMFFISSLLLWRRIWALPGARELQLFVHLWHAIGFLTIFSGLGTVWAVSACVDELEASAETAMLNGIDAYYTCPDCKLHWDELQYTKQCCGVNSYRDWMETIWMAELLDPSEKGNGSTTYAPYACCRHDYPDCFENYSPNAQNVACLNVSLINTSGCLPLYTKHIWRLHYIVLGLLMVALKLQLFICALARFIGSRQTDECLDDSSTIRLGSSSSTVYPNMEDQGVIEMCSCGKVLRREDSDECKNFSMQNSSEKCCCCHDSEIIH